MIFKWSISLPDEGNQSNLRLLSTIIKLFLFFYDNNFPILNCVFFLMIDTHVCSVNYLNFDVVISICHLVTFKHFIFFYHWTQNKNVHI